jgi:carbon-monoxide dehydrogenase large subunit
LQFGLARDQLRVVARDVGGSFGLKSGLAREEALVFWAARRLGRAIRWTAGRNESFLCDEHGRDVHAVTELGLDEEGHFTALKVTYNVNVGAYLSARSNAPIGNFGGIAGVYRTPLIVGEAIGYFTNTQPTAPYRGAGRPDATFMIERIIDVAASELGIDPAEMRRRNLIAPEALPYQTPFVFRYDSGDFQRCLDRALALADYEGFAERRRVSEAKGLLRGIGIANPIEVAAGPYAKPGTDYATIKVHPDGTATLLSGAMSVGQGLETALSGLVAQALGLPLDNIHYIQGDTDRVVNGKGNGGSAALTLGGSAIKLGVEQLLEKAKAIAAVKMDLQPQELEFADGVYRAINSNLTMTLGEVATAAEELSEEGLSGTGQFTMIQPTFPNGCHICEVEIDPETGSTRFVGYVSVEDIGRVMNPMLVEGQIHGGVAQGLGQVVGEQIRFDDDGQLLTGSFMDYAMPRASDLPRIVSDNVEVPTALNPLGVKGVGEAGTVGGLAAGMNSICNALSRVGIRHLDMPATPARIWEAIQKARKEGEMDDAHVPDGSRP